MDFELLVLHDDGEVRKVTRVEQFPSTLWRYARHLLMYQLGGAKLKARVDLASGICS